jgi:spore coat protein U-like protein
MTITTFCRNASILSAFGLIAFAQPAAAQTATGTMDATANVTENCIVNSTALTFGDTNVTDGAEHPGTGVLTVRCTAGTAWVASADAGAGGAGATVAQRQMTFGANKLNYILYNSDTNAAIWGDGTDGTSTIVGTGTGSDVALTLAGTIPGGQTLLPAGAYTDTVNVSVVY